MDMTKLVHEFLVERFPVEMATAEFVMGRDKRHDRTLTYHTAEQALALHMTIPTETIAGPGDTWRVEVSCLHVEDGRMGITIMAKLNNADDLASVFPHLAAVARCLRGLRRGITG